MNKICKVNGCNKSSSYKDNGQNGYCSKHNYHFKKYGKILERTKYDPNEFIFENNICKIKLYNNKHKHISTAIIDSEDYNKIKDYKWHLAVRGYVRSYNKNKKIIRLHHLILGYPPKEKRVDHINRNKLDNRKKNLRFITNQNNTINSKIRKNNKSGFKGVSWNKLKKKWESYLTFDYKCYKLGYFKNKIEAAKAYNEAALKYHGEFAILNKI